MQPNVSLKRDATFAVFALGVVAATSILGQIATYPNLVPWYAGLAKPSFNPPNPDQQDDAKVRYRSARSQESSLTFGTFMPRAVAKSIW